MIYNLYQNGTYLGLSGSMSKIVKMIKSTRFLFALFMCGLLVACADVKFSKLPECERRGIDCSQCIGDDCFQVFSQDVVIGAGKVDILFITDNSGSMSTEQAAMANRFPNFLDRIKNLDYQIAVITGDVSASPGNGPKAANGNGAFQDGRFLEFSSGEKILRPGSSNKEQKFRNTVMRNETVTCENSNFQPSQCPSPDERSIYAANLALDRNESNFFRTDAHLAIVILSDEDERSRTRIDNGDVVGDITGYALTDYDQPETFIDRFERKFPSKTLGVHSIIVRPGDNSCKSTQDAQNGGVKGYFGYLYREFAQTTNGVIGNICASDYGQQMGQIGTSIVDSVSSIKLDCRPKDDQVDITFIPEPIPPLQISYDFDNLVIRFDRALPENTRVSVQYQCEI